MRHRIGNLILLLAALLFSQSLRAQLYQPGRSARLPGQLPGQADPQHRDGLGADRHHAREARG